MKLIAWTALGPVIATKHLPPGICVVKKPDGECRAFDWTRRRWAWDIFAFLLEGR